MSKASVWACFIVGVGMTVLNMFFKWFDSSITAGAAAMLVGFIVVPVVTIFTKKPDEEKINEIFSCYEEKVMVSSKKVLVDEEAQVNNK